MKWDQFQQLIGFSLEDSQLEQLQKLQELLLRYNSKHNLISPKDEPVILERHLQDSLTPLRWIGEIEGPHLDFGSGTGFPLLPLAIAQPHRLFVAVESRSTRVLQMKHLANQIGIQNIEWRNSTIEQLIEERKGECLYTSVTARAVSSLEKDAERAYSVMKSGGRFVTFKSAFPEQPPENFKMEWWSYQLHPDLKEYYSICLEKLR